MAKATDKAYLLKQFKSFFEKIVKTEIVKNNGFVGTSTEYETVKDTLPDGTQITFTDK